jgi:hypothetical protein
MTIFTFERIRIHYFNLSQFKAHEKREEAGAAPTAKLTDRHNGPEGPELAKRFYIGTHLSGSVVLR